MDSRQGREPLSTNVELVRSVYAGWGRGDWSSAEWAHPDIEYVQADGPDPGSWQGLAEIADAVRGHLNAWDDLWVESEEYRELDDERVLALTRRGGRGKMSGFELGQLQAPGAHVFHIRDGKVARVILYFDRDRALADLGLPPETSSAAPQN